MTPREKLMFDALSQIAARDCAGFCGLIARKMIEKMRSDQVEEIITTNEEVIEVYNRTFNK